MDDNPIAKRLRELRAARGLTQEQTAEAIGVSHNAYSRYEIGSRVPNAQNAMKLADFYGITVSQLFNENAGPKDGDRPPVSDEDIRFALSSGDSPITWAQYQEVKMFARFIQERDRNNDNK